MWILSFIDSSESYSGLKLEGLFSTTSTTFLANSTPPSPPLPHTSVKTATEPNSSVLLIT